MGHAWIDLLEGLPETHFLWGCDFHEGEARCRTDYSGMKDVGVDEPAAYSKYGEHGS
jgi:hypothetical protein